MESKSVAPDPDNEFEKQGVKFKIITEEMAPKVVEFMWKNFFPDEPISRYAELAVVLVILVILFSKISQADSPP